MIGIAHHGSIVLVSPELQDGEAERFWDWVDDNVPEYSVWCGALAVEPRYVDHLMIGLAEAGFEIE